MASFLAQQAAVPDDNPVNPPADNNHIMIIYGSIVGALIIISLIVCFVPKPRICRKKQTIERNNYSILTDYQLQINNLR